MARKRIGLSMKLDAAPARHNNDKGPRDNRFEGASRDQRGGPNRGGVRAGTPQPASSTAMASAFGKLAGLKN